VCRIDLSCLEQINVSLHCDKALATPSPYSGDIGFESVSRIDPLYLLNGTVLDPDRALKVREIPANARSRTRFVQPIDSY
jgi:hypothetical protein